MDEEKDSEPIQTPAIHLPLPPSKTQLVADELERCARAADARGNQLSASKFRDRASLLRQGTN